MQNISLIHHSCKIQLPDCSKLAINRKNDIDITIFSHDAIVNFIWCCRVSFVKFSYWSRFHVNIIIDSRVLTIFLYKGLTRNQEIGNTPPEFCPISRDWGKLGIPNLTRMPLMKCYWMLKNASFYHFWVIKGKPTGVGVTINLTPLTSRLGLTLWHSVS